MAAGEAFDHGATPLETTEADVWPNRLKHLGYAILGIGMGLEAIGIIADSQALIVGGVGALEAGVATEIGAAILKS